jgi:hypothetical protein
MRWAAYLLRPSLPSCSWINLVECFFSVITRQAIRRGSFTSVKELTSAIGAFIDQWNDHPVGGIASESVRHDRLDDYHAG